MSPEQDREESVLAAIVPRRDDGYTRAQVREALEGSIMKWQRIVAGGTNGCASDCALCRLFNPYQKYLPLKESIAQGCLGCPVMARTGQSFCKGSPYERYEELEHDVDDDSDDDADIIENGRRLRETAEQELAFLESLR